MKTLDDLCWESWGNAMSAARVGDYNVYRHAKEYGTYFNIWSTGGRERAIYQRLDAITCQAVLVHLTQGGNDEDAGRSAA